MALVRIRVNGAVDPGPNLDVPIDVQVDLENVGDGTETTWKWLLVEYPSGGITDPLPDDTAQTYSFIPRVRGSYLIQLTCNAGTPGQAVGRTVVAVRHDHLRVPAVGEERGDAGADGWGPAVQDALVLLDSTKTQVDATDVDVAALDVRVTDAEADILTLDGRLDVVEPALTALTGRVDQTEIDINALEGRMDDAEADILALQAVAVTAGDGLVNTAGVLSVDYGAIAPTGSLDEAADPGVSTQLARADHIHSTEPSNDGAPLGQPILRWDVHGADVHVGGRMFFESVEEVVADRDLSANDSGAHVLLCYTVALGTIEVTLPPAGGDLMLDGTSRVLTIKNMGPGTTTVLAVAPETIDGQPDVDLTVQYAAITLLSDGASWWVIGKVTP